MGYYAMLVPAFVGHLNPSIVLARALQKRGHRIAFITLIDGRSKVEKAGLEVTTVGEKEFPRGEWDRMTAAMGELTGIRANRFAGHWLGLMARGIIRELPTLIQRERFDGLIMDQVCIGAEAVCQVEKIPLAVACCALAMNPEWGAPPVLFPWAYNPSLLARLRNLLGYFITNSSGFTLVRAVTGYRLKNRLGQMRLSHMNRMPPSLVQVTQQPAFFDFPRRYLPAHFHYTGPWKEQGIADEGDFPWDRLDGRPLIYASMGTLQNRLQHVFQIIAEACAPLDVQLVIALGHKHATLPAPLPGNPIVVGYALQAALLKRASIVITHGGLNTTLETLQQGLPMALIPVTNDQPGVAIRVERLGAGIKLNLKTLQADLLRAAIQRLRNEPTFATRARQLSDKIAETNGPALAAELIETAFTTRQPTLRQQRQTPDLLNT